MSFSVNVLAILSNFLEFPSYAIVTKLQRNRSFSVIQAVTASTLLGDALSGLDSRTEEIVFRRLFGTARLF